LRIKYFQKKVAEKKKWCIFALIYGLGASGGQRVGKTRKIPKCPLLNLTFGWQAWKIED